MRAMINRVHGGTKECDCDWRDEDDLPNHCSLVDIVIRHLKYHEIYGVEQSGEKKSTKNAKLVPTLMARGNVGGTTIVTRSCGGFSFENVRGHEYFDRPECMGKRGG